MRTSMRRDGFFVLLIVICVGFVLMCGVYVHHSRFVDSPSNFHQPKSARFSRKHVASYPASVQVYNLLLCV